jgi:primosomal protein N' (replication factor Y)
VAVHVSTADHLHSDVIEAGIVIATPGVAPTAKTGYSAVVILEADRFLSQPDMRAQERVREMFFSHAALISSQGEVIFVGDTSHPIITSLTSWNPSMAIHQELQERSELHLPPYSRVVIFTMETVEVVRFKNALLKAHEDGLVPQSTSILGPVPRGDKSSLILSTSVGDGDSLVTTLHEFMRRRSASKKSLPRMRIDPYSLSH